ncbi:mitochondrial disaggregase isoform X5 [Hydra vulgaris]|uniref:Mitochondrial disaggregase isoform X5 n=1 Tax=Hydra vulgaris TaxID=6087 RepID=A0ABM4D2L4_HYDVU
MLHIVKKDIKRVLGTLVVSRYRWLRAATINYSREDLFVVNISYSNFSWKNTLFKKLQSQIFISFGVLGAASFYRHDDDSSESLCIAAAHNDLTNLERLIKNSKDVNKKHPLGWTALHSAAMAGNARAVKMLLDAGADPDVLDDFSTAYKIASRHGIRVFDVIDSRQSCFNRTTNNRADFSGFTPLHYACLADDYETICLLLEAGADPTIKDKSNHFAYEYVYKESNKNLIKKYQEKFNEKQALLESEERRRYPLEQRFREVIVGQQGAIQAVSSAIRRRQNGWVDDQHPLVFLFLGSSGIGKTELAKQLAKFLHKDVEKSFIRLDMSEYQEKHEVSKLIGSPPGYVGYEQGGQLTTKLKAFPKAVVLFDEVEKAHPDVLTVMLQLFDEGRLTDGHGKTVECKDAIFVMTSNLASEEIADHALELRQMAKENKVNKLGHDISEDEHQIQIGKNFKENTIYPILKYHFRRDEFLGRITEFVFFLPFSKQELLKLVEKELLFWSHIAKKKHSIELSWEADVLEVLADGYNVHYGARSIKHEVERRVINQLAAAHERKLITKNNIVRLKTMYPKVENEDITVLKPTIKLEVTDSNLKTQDIFITDPWIPEAPIF